MSNIKSVEIKNLSLVFNTNDGPVHALNEIELDIIKGDFVSLIGPSGCGKTTLLRVIADLQEPTSGSILVNEKSAERARMERDYGYVFQSPALFPWRTISGNIGLPLEIMGFEKFDRFTFITYVDSRQIFLIFQIDFPLTVTIESLRNP